MVFRFTLKFSPQTGDFPLVRNCPTYSFSTITGRFGPRDAAEDGIIEMEQRSVKSGVFWQCQTRRKMLNFRPRFELRLGT